MFKLDSPLMNFLNKVADIMILNFLFFIFCIPFFTIGAAFSAAYYMGFKMVKNEETYIIKGFWKAFRENFKQGTAIWIILLAVFGVLAADYHIMAYSGIEFAQWIRIAMIAVTIVVLMGVVFMFPLQARFINPVKNTIKNAFLMALSHLPTAFLLVAVYAVPIVILYFIPQSLPVLIALAFGVVIYIKSFLLLRVFKKYEDALVDRNQETSHETDDSETDSGIFAESDRIERENKTVKVFRNGKFVEVPESSLKNDSTVHK
ncbi:MAG: DUF624 domain-containing protein [Lachnospiraceae bacterium]|nr:DUF624 domain-containing protein [Lachnospiraceae bacterium]